MLHKLQVLIKYQASVIILTPPCTHHAPGKLNAAIVVGNGGGKEHIADRGAMRAEAPAGASVDHDVGHDGLHSQERRQSRRNGSNVVNSELLALSVARHPHLNLTALGLVGSRVNYCRAAG